MALFRRSSSDAHWSKDYIEHLRSVHFVLIAVAVTCIAVSRGPDLTQLENAQTEIHQIVGVSSRKLASIRSSDKNVQQFITVAVENQKYFSELETDFVNLGDGDDDSDCKSELPGILVSTNYVIRKLASADTLSGFVDGWNGLVCHGETRLVLPLSISRTVVQNRSNWSSVASILVGEKAARTKGLYPS